METNSTGNDGVGSDSDAENGESVPRSRSARTPAAVTPPVSQSSVLGFDFCASAGAADTAGSSNKPAAEDDDTAQRRALRLLFPVRGVECVGCVLGAKMDPITRYIQEHTPRMAPDTVFKMAALLYKQTVVANCSRNGTFAPQFRWRDIRTHYRMHRIDGVLSRCETIRALLAMRKTIERAGVLRSRMDDDGETHYDIDKASAELYLKILAQEDRERILLQSLQAAPEGGSRAARGRDTDGSVGVPPEE
tara:strand:+ start:2341 stop:3087 length:747 start_codon:yes stop_codon:yes gene_type:complete